MPDLPVQAHLFHVATTLGSRRVPSLDPVRAAGRTRLIRALRAYAAAGVFPRPLGPVESRERSQVPSRSFRGAGVRAPIFEDHRGVRCAVAHLVAQDDPGLVCRLRDQDNGAWLPDVVSPELDAWGEAHGFDPDELAWIQPSYCFELQTCDEVDLTPPPAYAQQCTGPDASFNGASSWFADCQVCDGPYRVFAYVGNMGSEVARDVTVTLGRGESEVLATMGGVEIAPGEVVTVGPFDLGSVVCTETDGWLRASVADDCWGDWDQLPISYEGNGGPLAVLPEECGGGCGDTGAPLGDDTEGSCAALPGDTGDPADDTDGCGCGSGAASVLPLGWIGASLLRRRRPYR